MSHQVLHDTFSTPSFQNRFIFFLTSDCIILYYQVCVCVQSWTLCFVRYVYCISFIYLAITWIVLCQCFVPQLAHTSSRGHKTPPVHTLPLHWRTISWVHHDRTRGSNAETSCSPEQPSYQLFLNHYLIVSFCYWDTLCITFASSISVSTVTSWTVVILT